MRPLLGLSHSGSVCFKFRDSHVTVPAAFAGFFLQKGTLNLTLWLWGQGTGGFGNREPQEDWNVSISVCWVPGKAVLCSVVSSSCCILNPCLFSNTFWMSLWHVALVKESFTKVHMLFVQPSSCVFTVKELAWFVYSKTCRLSAAVRGEPLSFKLWP